MSQPIKGTAVRLPLDLHTLISDAAAANSRSRHAEMLHRLERSFGAPPALVDSTDVAASLCKVAETVVADVMTRLFAGLEDRLAALIAKKMEAAEMSLITEVRIDGNAELFAEAVRGHDFTTGKRRASPTGRLSESRPELQDLPSVSGINTLAASIRPMHCRAFEGATELVNFGGFHSGGFCGLPAGELPKILEKGEPVIPLSECKFQSTVTVLNLGAQPLIGQTWVLTGSLETMTRDRAREIIMELGGTVAGNVDQKTHALVWGPGAGSKKTRAEQLGVQQYTEHQFVKLIRGHGVDMPLPTDDERWLENTGSCPVQPDVWVEIKVSGSPEKTGRAGGFVWTLEDEPEVGDISHWRIVR